MIDFYKDNHVCAWVRAFVNFFFKPFPKQALVFTCLQYKSFENAVGKREIAYNEQFLLLPQCFSASWRPFCHFHQI